MLFECLELIPCPYIIYKVQDNWLFQDSQIVSYSGPPLTSKVSLKHCLQYKLGCMLLKQHTGNSRVPEQGFWLEDGLNQQFSFACNTGYPYPTGVSYFIYSYLPDSHQALEMIVIGLFDHEFFVFDYELVLQLIPEIQL